MFLGLSGGAIALNLLFLVLGILLLVKGADFFVGGASSIAKKLKISALVIGLTVVSFGTSAPELAVSVSSSIKGESGIALGNVVGSNIMNLLVVLGLSSVLSPILVKKSLTKREFPFLIGATVLLLIFVADNLFAGLNGTENLLARNEALIFVFGIVAFCYMSIVMAKKDSQKELLANPELKAPVEEEIQEMPLSKSIILLLVGLVGIVVGAEFITTPATTLATAFGESMGIEKNLVENVVGLTIVAIGTSLPELVTSIMAAKKGENEIAIGNVVGSNIFNILFICGISGLITPLSVTTDILTDMIISLFVTGLVFYFSKKGKLTRGNGGVLLLVYAIYLAYILTRLFFPQIVLPL